MGRHHATSPVAGQVCGLADSLSPFAIATGDEPIVPETTILSGPPAISPSGTATFFFSSGDPLATFECSRRRRPLLELLRVAAP